MSALTPVLDPSTKRWLTLFAVMVVVAVLVITHNLTRALTAVSGESASAMPAASLRPRPVLPPVRWPAVPAFSPPLSEAQQKTNFQQQVREQANYLRQLSKQYPKTASLPTPEQIDQMEKAGRLAE